MNRLTALLMLLSILTGSCQSDDAVTIENRTDTIIASSPPAAESDPFVLGRVNQEETALTVVVRYSGGCKEHLFSVYWDGVATKSIPPQLVVNVYHDDRGDTCEAYLNNTISIDVEELLGDRWNLDEEAVLIIIRNADDGETVPIPLRKW